MILTKKSVDRHLIRPLRNKNFDIELVGSIKGIFERSHHDIDTLLYLPEYPHSNKVFDEFEIELNKLGWKWEFTVNTKKYGILHYYTKRSINRIGIGLDVFINEDK
jgi:hypothetical protein